MLCVCGEKSGMRMEDRSVCVLERERWRSDLVGNGLVLVKGRIIVYMQER